ncbi:hypothetical protein HPB51_003078 [Rhipicephalus microplus]|uniref:Reverse transcriptase domain-containing protein n=1 Tax=Rhipicephalus microplus TaxID=6941 RepID=A0A9J6EEN5_RHIMP|nr:hypothetical protein HPB51_003078 [Rhipicephalus microplus]
MAKRAKRKEREEPMVQCEKCRRWAYLDETSFPSMEAADAAEFVCNLCSTIEVLQARMRASETEIDTLRGVILAVKEQLREPLRAAEHSCPSRPVLTASTAAQTHSVDVLQERDQAVVESEGGRPLQSGQEQLSYAVVELSYAVVGEQSGEGAQRGGGSSSHTTGEAQGLPERTHETGGVGETMNLKHGTAAGLDGSKADDQSLTNAQNNEQRPGKWKKNKKAACRYTPEVLVVGDGNAPRIAGELRRIWGNSVLVRQVSERRMTADKLQHLLQSRSEGEGHSAQLVVVHVGVHDVLKGVQHGDIAQNIRQAVTPYAKRLVICSVPEVNTRGKATQARAMLLNAELRKMSGAVKAKFVDLSRMLAGEGRLAQDGIHYLAHTTREVATQLVQETRNFLGLREPHRNRGKPTRRPPPNIGSRVPMPALEIHSPSPEPPKTTSVITHQGEIRADVRTTPGQTLREHTQPVYAANMAQLAPLSTPRPPGTSLAPPTWGPHLGTAHPTKTPWQAFRLSASPELLHVTSTQAWHVLAEQVRGEGRQGFESSPQRRESRSYSEFMRALDAVMRTQMVQERPGRRPQNPWWDKEVEVAWKERRQANREHRRFVKGLDTEVCAEKWAVYLDRKHKVQTLIQCKIADYNLRLIQSIRQEGRSAAHKFWTYIRSLDRAAPPPPPLIDAATGQPVGEPCEYIAQHFSRIFGTSDLNTDTTLSKEEAISPNTERPPSQTEPPWALSRFTVERALKRIRAGTATGLDGMPARVLKCLGEDSREQLAEILTAIIEGEPIPKEWHEGKVILIPKRGGDARNIEDYRPITVTSVMYRLFAGVIKAWMSGWAETKGLLTELQNGFRPGRRLDDNLFVVTQCAEIARREGRTLLCCFLDVEKAYDSVPHGPLFACLSDLGLPRLLISTIQRLYSDNVVSVQLGAITTGPIHVNKGLRQGCPLSPLLYILYASRIERALLNSNLGFSMRFSTTSAEENFHLPGLAFADDLVVMAESNQELQSLLDICQTELASLGLRFNTKKSAVVRLTGGSTDAAALTLGGELLATRNDYRYLGVTLCVDAAKYSLHETVIRQTALQAQRILRRRCLWGCNRFQMIRDLWKMVHVPGLTFGNAVVCISPTTREWLERQQREVGRAALGCHYRVANEAIQGDVGWSSFEAREAASKIAYRGRLTLMRRTRWARRVFEYLSATCLRTDWTRRLYQLEKKYGFFAEASPIETAAKWTVEVRMRVREAEENPMARSYGGEVHSRVLQETPGQHLWVAPL